MGTDINWEQKVRISALRAASATMYSLYDDDNAESTDDGMTDRIITRAERFKRYLLQGVDNTGMNPAYPFKIMMSERAVGNREAEVANAQLFEEYAEEREAIRRIRECDSERVHYWLEYIA